MTALSILTALLLVGLLVVRAALPGWLRAGIPVLAAFLILLQGVRFFVAEEAPTSAPEHLNAFEQAAALVLGQEILKQVREPGLVALIQADDLPSVAKARLEGLTEALTPEGFEVEVITVSLPKDEWVFAMGNWVSSDVFHHALERSRHADVVVSAIGLPEDAMLMLSQDKRPFFALGVAVPEDVYALISRDLIQACVVHREEADWRARPDTVLSPEQIFDLRYVLLTKESLRHAY